MLPARQESDRRDRHRQSARRDARRSPRSPHRSQSVRPYQAHAHSDWPVAQRIARRRCRRQRVGRLRERHEERVSLCPHLDTAVARELFAQRVMMTGQQVRVLVAPLLQQPRRALDVGEQERDGPTWSGTSERPRSTTPAGCFGWSFESSTPQWGRYRESSAGERSWWAPRGRARSPTGPEELRYQARLGPDSNGVAHRGAPSQACGRMRIEVIGAGHGPAAASLGPVVVEAKS